MQSARKRDEKRQRLREAKESEELSKCSGTPKINSKSRSIATVGQIWSYSRRRRAQPLAIVSDRTALSVTMFSVDKRQLT